MRQVLIFVAAFFCLALLSRNSVARADGTIDDTKELKEGTVWEGTSKARYPDGSVRTGACELTVTKRDGKSVECRTGKGGKNYWKFEGEVDANGQMNMTITKVVSEDVEWRKKGLGRNLVGVKLSGALDGKALTLKAVQPEPNHPKTESIIRTWTLKLKDDE